MRLCSTEQTLFADSLAWYTTVDVSEIGCDTLLRMKPRSFYSTHELTEPAGSGPTLCCTEVSPPLVARLRMLIAALWSRARLRPHSQLTKRTQRSKSWKSCPQHEQVLEV